MRAVLLGFLSVVALQALLVGVVDLQALLVGVLLSAQVVPLHGLRCLDLTSRLVQRLASPSLLA